MEALKSPLMGLFEKRRDRKFFIYVQEYNENDLKTHDGMDLSRLTTRDLIKKYGLDDSTIDFIGHALALHSDDQYLNAPALDSVKRMKLYAESLARFGGGSPYIYPLYGLAELPQAFARLSAVYGGTYMLAKPECKVEFDEEGKVFGVSSEGETTKSKKLVCDPSYLPSKVFDHFIIGDYRFGIHMHQKCRQMLGNVVEYSQQSHYSLLQALEKCKMKVLDWNATLVVLKMDTKASWKFKVFWNIVFFCPLLSTPALKDFLTKLILFL